MVLSIFKLTPSVLNDAWPKTFAGMVWLPSSLIETDVTPDIDMKQPFPLQSAPEVMLE